MKRYKHWVLPIFGSVMVGLLFMLFWPWLGLMTAVFSIVTILFLNDYKSSLVKRIKAKDPITWDIFLNNIKVGTVTDSQYAAMQQYAFLDRWNSIAQVLNIGRILLILLNKLFVTAPVIVFWVIITLALIEPESIAMTIREILKAEPEMVSSFVLSALINIVLFPFMVVMVLVAVYGSQIGQYFGFKNHYKDDIARMLRLHCNMAAEGHLELCLIESEIRPGASLAVGKTNG